MNLQVIHLTYKCQDQKKEKFSTYLSYSSAIATKEYAYVSRILTAEIISNVSPIAAISSYVIIDFVAVVMYGFATFTTLFPLFFRAMNMKLYVGSQENKVPMVCKSNRQLKEIVG
ncbi:MAG TPA: hypothetical protein VED00_02945 [archaeon]|nr:hypothetical protein [archaeon]